MNILRQTVDWNTMTAQFENIQLEQFYLTSPIVTYDDFDWKIVAYDTNRYISSASCKNINSQQMQLDLYVIGVDPNDNYNAEVLKGQQILAQAYPGYFA